MTKTKELFTSAITGLVDLSKRDGRYPDCFRKDTPEWDRLWIIIEQATPLNLPMLEYKPSSRGFMTHVVTVHGDVEKIYRDSGHGTDYDHCDGCGALDDVDFMNTYTDGSQLCDNCAE